MKRVSVAMAVYEGERYLAAQLDSILEQLGAEDELVISYNESADGTYALIEDYAARDARIKLFVCEEKGHLPNFENALAHCEGRYIFLSDQDDLWEKDKLERMLAAFDESQATMVLHEVYVCDGQCVPQYRMRQSVHGRKGLILNLIKPRFQGAAMAFQSCLLPYILPIPREALYHDMWIGLINEAYGSLYVLGEPLLYFRRHGANASVTARRSAAVILKERKSEARALLSRLKALKRAGHKRGELK